MIGPARYVAAAAGTALLLAALFGWWQYGRAERLAGALVQAEERRAADRLTFERARAELQGSIDRLTAQRRLDQEMADRLAADHARIARERDDEKAKLDQYRRRIAAAALAKPGLVGALATRAAGRLFDDFARATGGDPDRDRAGAPVPPAAAGGGAPAGPDRGRGADPGRDGGP